MQASIEQIPHQSDLLSLHRRNPQRYPVLLESSAHGTAQGRWDILCVAVDDALCLYSDLQVRDARGNVYPAGFIQALDAAWQAERVKSRPTAASIPFIGGWAVLLDYDVLLEIEPTLAIPMHTAKAHPIAVALRCPAAIVQDHQTGTCHLVVETAFAALKPQIHADIIAAQQIPPLPAWQPAQRVDEQSPDHYLAMVRRALADIRAGNIFQANLSRPWQAEFAQPVSPAALFAQLRRYNPAPFAALFVAQGRCVVSSSPERLVQVDGDCIQTRPIAGTRPRDGHDAESSLAAFRRHPKEHAEHVMLIDLGRNDLGRISLAGTVEVDEWMAIETYPHVHHLVSNVKGRLVPGTTPGNVLRALFPGGTITGCPKVRCIQIIAELEQSPRGAYTGAIGWIGRDGNLDLNILIRSVEVASRSIHFRTGAGIVLDSSPQRELEETRAKAKGLLRAVTAIE